MGVDKLLDKIMENLVLHPVQKREFEIDGIKHEETYVRADAKLFVELMLSGRESELVRVGEQIKEPLRAFVLRGMRETIHRILEDT